MGVIWAISVPDNIHVFKKLYFYVEVRCVQL